MKLSDLIKKGSLIDPAHKCSNSSNCSSSKTSNGLSSVASTLINKIKKSSNCSKSSYTPPLNGEDMTVTHKPAATATPAIPATDGRPLPYLDLDGGLVIPFGCDSRFLYWHGGQSIAETEKELRWKN